MVAPLTPHRERAEDALARAKSLIASALLAGGHRAPTRCGGVSLRPHQRDAVERLRSMLDMKGGALLADHVGLGKTYTALAVAADFANVLVVAPASLREMWRTAADAASVSMRLVTMQALSSGFAIPSESYDLIIVDEAHHLRERTTKRYTALAALCQQAKVLLLSATPVQNRRDDLIAQLALFLGSRASALADAELADFVVRRDKESAAESLPLVQGPMPIHIGESDDILDDIMALPLPIPAADEGMAGALTAYSLIHLWSSSRAALIQSLRRRRARAHALREAALGGRMPTRQELTAWACDGGGGSLQLAFTELVVAPAADLDARSLVDRLERYIDASSRLIERARSGDDPDAARASGVAAILDRHPGARVVIFSQYAETVTSTARALRARAGIALMTARGGRIASGTLPRAEILAQFDPTNLRSRNGPAIERIGALLTTDVLSEGVNLHAASVVVHLDLPWNPARLEQRVGRVRRLGASHTVVHVYALMPPAPAARIIRIEERLKAKLASAGESIGTIRLVLPNAGTSCTDVSAPEAMERIRTVVGRWPHVSVRAPLREQHGAIAGVAGMTPALLAAVSIRGRTMLIAELGGVWSCDPRVVEPLVRQLDSTAVTIDDAATALIRARIRQWFDARRGSALAGLDRARVADARRRALSRIEGILAGAPRHRRASFAALGGVARAAATQPLAAGSESVLFDLTNAEMDEEAWLRAVAEFGRLHARDLSHTAAVATPDRLIAAISFVATPAASR